MLRKTMAVGPLEPVASCVTGWAGVAKYRAWFDSCEETRGDDEPRERPLANCLVEILDAMARHWFWGG